MIIIKKIKIIKRNKNILNYLINKYINSDNNIKTNLFKRNNIYFNIIYY